MPDHTHIFIGMKPICNLSELVREIKKSSTNWINRSNLSTRKFQWQSSYGAFSVSPRGLSPVAKYIENQKAHHLRKSFKKEYLDLLKDYDIRYEEKYLFEFREDRDTTPMGSKK
jgi:hypothetical protein